MVLWKICWVEVKAATILWLVHKAATGPATAPPPPGSSFSFSISWARCVLSPVMRGPGFGRTPATPRSEATRITWGSVHPHRLQLVLVGSRLFLLSPTLHPSSFPVCPVDFKFRHQTEITALQKQLNWLPQL